MIIKICGMRRPEDIANANKLCIDYAGVILSQGFRRTISHDTARMLKSSLDASIKLVGVFVNDDIDVIASLVTDGTIDIVQLHGDEGDDYIKALRQKANVPIIKAFTVKSSADIERANRSIADIILLDAGKGTGTTFDWQLLSSVTKPFILAGGLTPDNVADAVTQVKPYGVDTSSGVEKDGVKDFTLMMSFVENARSAAH